jgi:signal transduction histidine kinase
MRALIRLSSSRAELRACMCSWSRTRRSWPPLLAHVTPGTRLPEPAGRHEISRLAETLNEMLARLEAAFGHERRFIADASHELRTPLALLKTELVERKNRRRRGRRVDRGRTGGKLLVSSQALLI